MVENIHHARHVAQLPNAEALNSVIIETIRSLYRRGEESGVFRSGIDPVDLYQSIAALNFFNVSNRATFTAIFNRDMASPEALAARRQSIIDAILKFVAP
jgi:hypothetical protein